MPVEVMKPKKIKKVVKQTIQPEDAQKNEIIVGVEENYNQDIVLKSKFEKHPKNEEKLSII
jgi:hypothetical protein